MIKNREIVKQYPTPFARNPAARAAKPGLPQRMSRCLRQPA